MYVLKLESFTVAVTDYCVANSLLALDINFESEDSVQAFSDYCKNHSTDNASIDYELNGTTYHGHFGAFVFDHQYKARVYMTTEPDDFELSGRNYDIFNKNVISILNNHKSAIKTIADALKRNNMLDNSEISSLSYCITFRAAMQVVVRIFRISRWLLFLYPFLRRIDTMAKYKKRKDGRYATTVMIGSKPDGKPNNVFLSAKTEKELKEKILELKIKIKTGEAVKTSDTLLRDYADSWLETYKASASINTRAMYINAINCHIKPEIGHLPLNKIVRSDVQKLINDRQEHPRTCEIIRLTLVQILNSAIDDKLLHENMAKKVTLPKRHKTEKRTLTELEKEAIKKADFTLQEKAFVMLLFYFGLRRGECLALTKADIDLKKKTLTINKTVVFDKNMPTIKDGAKSDAGNRTLPIPESIEPFLREFLRSVDSFYLFKGKTTETLSKTQYVRMWERIVKKMNAAVTSDKEKGIGAEPIQGLTAHIFRHNYCTMLYYSGISQKKAVELMGHSDLKMIMEVYAHLDEEKEAVQEKLNKAIAL